MFLYYKLPICSYTTALNHPHRRWLHPNVHTHFHIYKIIGFTETKVLVMKFCTFLALMESKKEKNTHFYFSSRQIFHFVCNFLLNKLVFFFNKINSITEYEIKVCFFSLIFYYFN